MTWRQLKTFVDEMDDMTLDSAIPLFDYASNTFYEPEICLDGEPEIHLIIN